LDAYELAERCRHAGITQLATHHGSFPKHLIQATEHFVARELRLQCAHHATRNLMVLG
jgi:hypothetical protein